MGLMNYLKGLYEEAKGSAQQEMGNLGKGAITLSTGYERIEKEKTNFLESTHIGEVSGSKEALDFVGDAISHKVCDVGSYVGYKCHQVKNFVQKF